MGGLSGSRFGYSGSGTALFTGTVSLENSGGFASVRSASSSHDLRKFSALTLRVKGDGKQYKINLKTDRNFDGVQYQAAFRTKRNEWMNVTIPFTTFTPVFRGNPVVPDSQLDRSCLCTFGFLISDKQEGPFRLEIESIGASP
jgi:hypothetical protein